jgi:hypothetical protein
MMGQVSETVHTIQWACASSSAMAADMIAMLLMMMK